MFNVLPFGLASACFVFTKMFRPFVRRCRESGQCAVMYIDDGISGHGQKQVLQKHSYMVQNDLKHAG